MFSDWSCVEEFLKMHVLLEGQAPQCSMGGGGCGIGHGVTVVS